MQRTRGFTLVELLVAIVVMSMLALLSWRSLDGMTRTQNITQQRADDLLRMQAAMGQWAADLDALIDTGEVNTLDFNGQVLRMTRRDSGESGLDSRGIRVVAWTRLTGVALAGLPQISSSIQASGQWVRWQSGPLLRRDELARAWQRAAEWGRGTLPSQTGNAGTDSAIALLGIDDWRLYYHRGEAWANPQSSVGSDEQSVGTTGTRTGDLPNGVRLELVLGTGEGLSGSLVRDWVRPTLEAGR
ncbi:MAG: prepilin-type N-terminal cleavage/methylation domain-containing protein [Hydrogenophaga sp.]|jgi:general secretion pathway protein J|uniref:prepilin-type N-terminal cleavage/methylation domain-containing protein n=1 Tax=Hydrogenophaga sp. TaxID=1904254 RepID=UPI001D7133B7|nr:prepilin-type N-terminal cleavage/methylation domain-containing protein [Hydrogenophaga sp.]MBW0169079.1 prepilin-type N-terminal cleavage/methylation domain-containing protein [Hydrogenophaga sp.]MBW0185439.1 prepilin-type N-terminal cleavage/methylation domain-containing protein [Hydrogenophaga sp.]